MQKIMLSLFVSVIIAGCGGEQNQASSGMAPMGDTSSKSSPQAMKTDPPAIANIPENAPVQEINMTAKKYEFNPSEIKAKQGTHLIIHVTSLDVEHGFAVKEYKTDVTIPAKGTAKVDMYLDKAGTFPFVCSRFCGLGHSHMKGTLIVEPKE